jgi:hypothetical protein
MLSESWANAVQDRSATEITMGLMRYITEFARSICMDQNFARRKRNAGT